MSQKQITVTYTGYTNNNGQPTCALNFAAGEVCENFCTLRLGSLETCIFSPVENGLSIPLERRGEDQLGLLIPGDWCPLWNNK